MNKSSFSTRLLDWYDAHARDLPWRVSPADRARGVTPDPYKVWLSEIMLQQTTVATVTPRFQVFLDRWPTVRDLAAAPLEDVLGEWAGLGYYARARNLHACARVVATALNGVFPQAEEELQALPGIGPYTAAAIAAIAFDVPATVVDGNVDRVMVRQGAIERPIREVKDQIYALAAARTPTRRAGDYAQALMDLGATLCRPKSPQCLLCPVQKGCAAFEEGVQDQLPVKPAKKVRPQRFGTVFVGINKAGDVVTERRAEKGLFGGMAGLPGSDWATEMPDAAPPYQADWQEVGDVSHTLTHFHLTLTVMRATVSRLPRGYFWTRAEALDTLPTVFRKAVNSSGSG